MKRDTGKEQLIDGQVYTWHVYLRTEWVSIHKLNREFEAFLQRKCKKPLVNTNNTVRGLHTNFWHVLCNWFILMNCLLLFFADFIERSFILFAASAKLKTEFYKCHNVSWKWWEFCSTLKAEDEQRMSNCWLKLSKLMLRELEIFELHYCSGLKKSIRGWWFWGKYLHAVATFANKLSLACIQISLVFL